MIYTINLYDEERNFCLRTDCDVVTFKTLLKDYKFNNTKINYNDFFEFVNDRGYFIDLIKPDVNLYF